MISLALSPFAPAGAASPWTCDQVSCPCVGFAHLASATSHSSDEVPIRSTLCTRLRLPYPRIGNVLCKPRRRIIGWGATTVCDSSERCFLCDSRRGTMGQKDAERRARGGTELSISRPVTGRVRYRAADVLCLPGVDSPARQLFGLSCSPAVSTRWIDSPVPLADVGQAPDAL